MGAALRLLVTLFGHWLHTGIGPIGPSHRNQFYLKKWYRSWGRSQRLRGRIGQVSTNKGITPGTNSAASIALSGPVWDRLNASISYNYLMEESNYAVLDFDRNIVTLVLAYSW